ncbi:porin [Rhodoferax sp.]|uniref:porin n=1 Tax=Rhodoferax sp. TaxID=50421 RepID=UPI00273463B2|nr:porin [Rhodoferax sp.]MDP3190699.1 porin [Rhodoferax sp.]MDP3335618.1 porin [Rhodoferax sp.]MDP3865583.1 porin [Rhodoferax sp.]
MKKSLIALAVLAASGAAMAQSSVTLYGRLDASIGQTRTESTGTASVRQTVLDQSQLNTTFWGLRGTEDIGGGLKANFKLESGFALDTGVGNTGLFERTATVGLSGGFGAVNLGRQYTAYDSLRGATNNVWDSNLSTTGAVWKATGMTDYTNRISNSVRYDSPVFSGISGSVAYGFGENKNTTTNVGDATDNVSLHVKYAAGPLLVGYAHQEEKQAQAVLTTAQVTNKYDLIGASYDFGVAKLTGSYNQAKNGTAKDKEYQVGVSVPFGAFNVAAGYSKAESDNTGLEGSGYTLVGTYDLSKRTTMYVGYKSTDVDTSATTKTEASTFAAGVRHVF